MSDPAVETARLCLDAAETGAMNFPEIVDVLSRAGVESYRIDYRRASAAYFRPDGTSFDLPTPFPPFAVASGFDAAAIQSAIRQAQAGGAGYTYAGFCRTVTAAGCAEYLVSFSGRRALYIGRTGETHVERFPD